MNRYCDQRDKDLWAVFDRQDKRFVYRYKTRDDARRRMRQLNAEEKARDTGRMEALARIDGNVGETPETPR